MNYTKLQQRKITGRGIGLAVSSLMGFIGFFAMFFAMWNMTATYATMVGLTIPFFVIGVGLWIAFGVYADKVSNKCERKMIVSNKCKNSLAVSGKCKNKLSISSKTKTRNVKNVSENRYCDFSYQKVITNNGTILFHYTAQRSMYKKAS